jgi:S-adenosylmethionine hydrolase
MRTTYFTTLLIFLLTFQSQGQENALVMQTDFGLKDGAVSAMKGVAFSVSRNLKIFDNTHEIQPFNIWEAAYRLHQTAAYWPKGTVFVSVVDPGVGSERRSVVMKTKSGHFIVTPDNGTLTFVADNMGIAEIRIIDETKNRLAHSQESYTFHGRDVYAYTGARLASGLISFEEVGPKFEGDIVRLPYQKPTLKNGIITGNVDILDIQYGNVWSNISLHLLRDADIEYGDKLQVKIEEDGVVKFDGVVLFGKTFADVAEGDNVAYVNSLLNFSLGVNQQDFSRKYKIRSGANSTIIVKEWK